MFYFQLAAVIGSISFIFYLKTVRLVVDNASLMLRDTDITDDDMMFYDLFLMSERQMLVTYVLFFILLWPVGVRSAILFGYSVRLFLLQQKK